MLQSTPYQRKSAARLAFALLAFLGLYACNPAPEVTPPALDDEGRPPATAPETPESDTPAKTNARTGGKTPESLRFMAYNVENYLEMSRYANGQNTTTGKPEKAKAALVRVIASAQPDILGICEIGTSEDLADLQSRLKQAGLDLPHQYLTGGSDPVRHLGLLSRFPISPNKIAGRLEYPIDGTIVEMSRGILDATVTVNENYQLRLLGVHLKSKREIPGMDQEEMRKNEALLLRHHATTILRNAPKTNLLVYGDLNETKNNSSITIVRGAGSKENHLEDIYLRDERGTTWTHNWKYADVYSRFDYALVSKALRPEIDVKRSYIPDSKDVSEASDHRPLLVTIEPEDH